MSSSSPQSSPCHRRNRLSNYHHRHCGPHSSLDSSLTQSPTLHRLYNIFTSNLRSPSNAAAADTAKPSSLTSSSVNILKSLTPERVLDAPGLMDDFYLNVLDWSSKNVLAVGLGSSVYLWNGQDSSVKELLTLSSRSPLSEIPSSHISSLSWIKDGRTLAVGSSDGQIQLWDVERGRKLRTMLVPDCSARVSSLSWNKHLLSSGCKDGKLQTHDVRVAQHLSTSYTSSPHGGGEICGLRWSGDGRILAAGNNDNMVRLYNPEDKDPFAILKGHQSAVKALSWKPDSPNILASGGGSQDKTIKLWDVRRTSSDASEDENDNDSMLLQSHICKSSVNSIKWITPTLLVSAHGGFEEQLCLWKHSGLGGGSSGELEKIGSLDGAHEGRILSLASGPSYSAGSSRRLAKKILIATAGADESIKFWPIKPTLSGSDHLGADDDDDDLSGKRRRFFPRLNDRRDRGGNGGDNDGRGGRRSRANATTTTTTRTNSPFSQRNRL